MNRWFRDDRTREAERLTFDADYPHGKDATTVLELYRQAAALWEAVAVEVADDHPNTRSDLAISAAVCWIKGGQRDKADDLCRRMLAAPAALSMRGRAELGKLLEDGLEVRG